jgi:tripartite-type tricarboxylate transporter receptor subunit TctC
MLIAPAGLPPRVAGAINRALVTTLAEPTVRDRMLNAGHWPPDGPNTLEGTRAYMAEQVALYRRIVEQTGVRLQP